MSRIGRPAWLTLASLHLLGAVVVATSAASAFDLPRSGASASPPVQADFPVVAASADAHRVADWVARSGDNRGLPFIIVDKANAKLFLFDGRAALRAESPVLLGAARGDDSPPGIGERKLSLITPAERITPAGRFVASVGENLAGQDILWVDYGAAVSLHRATDRKPGLTAKSRMDRLATASVLDNRITHGCINVSPEFYDRFIRTTFRATEGIVYVLPETRSVQAVFHLDPARGQASVPAPGDAG